MRWKDNVGIYLISAMKSVEDWLESLFIWKIKLGRLYKQKSQI